MQRTQFAATVHLAVTRRGERHRFILISGDKGMELVIGGTNACQTLGGKPGRA